jgi:hypothetical protein
MIRELKCPYGDDFEGGDECDRCEQYELCMESYPPLNLIEVPKGATNGDMIRIIFPKIEIYTDVINEIVDVEICENSSELRSSVDWWNAPYKRGDLDGSN